MAEEFAELALEGVPLVTEHYDKVYDPVKNKTKQGVEKIKSMRNKDGTYEESEEDDYYEYKGPPRRGKSQRDRMPRDDFEDDYRRDDRRRAGRGEVVEQRHAYRDSQGNGRARSVGRDGRGDRRRGGRRAYSSSSSSSSPSPRRDRRRKSLGEQALAALGLGGAASALTGKDNQRRRSRSRSRSRNRRRDRSDSRDYVPRGSRGYDDDRSRALPPVSRGGYDDDRTPARYKPQGYITNGDDDSNGRGNGQLARRDNNQVSRRGDGEESRGKKRDSSSSSDSSSDVCSSSEDERRTKKMKGKEYLTAGLAAVATIHAAHSVYSSMEARDKRHLEVAKGEMSPEEAKKKKNKARLQDAAAIGIAALGIKGAYSEWQEVQEHRHETAEMEEERKKHHEKRLRKQRKSQGRNRSEPDLNRRRDRSYD